MILKIRANLLNKISYNTIVTRFMHNSTDEPVANNTLENAIRFQIFLTDKLEKGLDLTSIIADSKKELYNDHYVTYETLINHIPDLVEDNPTLLSMLMEHDNLHIFNYVGDHLHPVINDHGKAAYDKFRQGLKLIEDIMADTPPVSDTSSLTQEEADTGSRTSFDLEDNRSDAFHQKDTSSGVDYTVDFGDNTGIILMTVGAFIVINVIAWYVRTYHKDTLVSQQREGNDEALLHSTLEPFYLQEFLGKLIALLFPAIVMFYTFRYYHFYTLKKHMKYIVNYKNT